jgi:hypothetical protein
MNKHTDRQTEIHVTSLRINFFYKTNTTALCYVNLSHKAVLSRSVQRDVLSPGQIYQHYVYKFKHPYILNNTYTQN